MTLTPHAQMPGWYVLTTSTGTHYLTERDVAQLADLTKEMSR